MQLTAPALVRLTYTLLRWLLTAKQQLYQRSDAVRKAHEHIRSAEKSKTQTNTEFLMDVSKTQTHYRTPAKQ